VARRATNPRPALQSRYRRLLFGSPRQRMGPSVPGVAVSQRGVTDFSNGVQRANGPLTISDTRNTKKLAPSSVLTGTLCSPLGLTTTGSQRACRPDPAGTVAPERISPPQRMIHPVSELATLPYARVPTDSKSFDLVFLILSSHTSFSPIAHYFHRLATTFTVSSLP
jgi:hypothetical protein